MTDAGEHVHLVSGNCMSTTTGDDSMSSEADDRMRRKLKYFFMNPCEKFQAKRRLPYKLLLQLVKIVFVTVQLIMFGLSRGAHIDFLDKTNLAFKHLFLREWTAAYETMPYPPSMGVYAIYTIPEFFSAVEFAVKQYNRTEQIAIGTYHFTQSNNTMDPMKMCKTYYRKGVIWAFNESYEFDSTQETDCFPILPVLVNATETYDIETYLDEFNKSINFDSIIKVWLEFGLKTVHLKSLSKVNSPDCYLFNIMITFDNSDHNGQMRIYLESAEEVLSCNGKVMFSTGEDDTTYQVLISIFDTIIILISLLSIVLCARSIFKAIELMKETEVFFAIHHPVPEFSTDDRMEFINMWYILIIINDILTTIGCTIKILIENKLTNSYETCGVFLGTGNLLVWIGVLRYLGFFKKYNVLIVTMKKSAPNVLRFLVCALVFYIGFAICGWVILGPYHLKFRQLSTASECLFSLINGDDIFTTFATMSDASNVMWWFSRLYLYFFISLFIYVILSIFISVIMDTYETIVKSYDEQGNPRSRLHAFADECRDDPDKLFPPASDGCCIIRCLKRIFIPQNRSGLSVQCDELNHSTVSGSSEPGLI